MLLRLNSINQIHFTASSLNHYKTREFQARLPGSPGSGNYISYCTVIALTRIGIEIQQTTNAEKLKVQSYRLADI